MSTRAGSPYVELRPVEERDWRAVHGWASREEVCRYQGWGPNTEEQTRAFVEQAVAAADERPRNRFVYVVTCDGEVVGSCELNLRGDGQGEIGYGLHPEHWGRGLATAAARLLLELCFTDLRLHRVFATCDPRNLASGRVLRRLGMTHEGRLREVLLIRDGWRDSDVYGLLAHEWSATG
ncbi:GNAT family N-acetyltransferase [Nocardioides panacis]|uniref:GNAT family N-acetyltransferase n=1 Tax=Nocardioides panacis TaxID=2849501 RepID=A0A975XZ80_9ACTN|nr:GNAT family protein [Nocardioides panacis]QWZ07146.1 GNAT family N-acetyltransferase [Nocardioides panacis]